MIGTEQKLWQRMRDTAPKALEMTRIETPTRAGVSDVEYVVRGGVHGWIELKTSSTKNESSLLTLHTPLTLQQLTWLLSHHNPKTHLCSWLLIGFLGPRTWRMFMLVPPKHATGLLHMRRAPLLHDLLRRPEVSTFTNVRLMLDFVAKRAESRMIDTKLKEKETDK